MAAAQRDVRVLVEARHAGDGEGVRDVALSSSASISSNGCLLTSNHLLFSVSLASRVLDLICNSCIILV